MNKSISIYIAIAAEQPALENLQRRASLSNSGDRDALLANPDAIALPIEQITAGQVFVAEWNDVIVGFAAVLPREDGDLELDALFVEPTRWKQGIGRSLVEYCVNVARTHGATALHVVGNPHAKTFYHACGFEMIGITRTQFAAGLLLRRSL